MGGGDGALDGAARAHGERPGALIGLERARVALGGGDGRADGLERAFVLLEAAGGAGGLTPWRGPLPA